ncbi:hypothetical protein KY289_001581 [Solanum tuberosum]|nr:hypothetical protein KY289_001581 [Solanum tuberosum]
MELKDHLQHQKRLREQIDSYLSCSSCVDSVGWKQTERCFSKAALRLQPPWKLKLEDDQLLFPFFCF